MTRRLEEILNLPDSKEIIKKEETPKRVKQSPPSFRNMSEFDKISAALPPVTGLDRKSVV